MTVERQHVRTRRGGPSKTARIRPARSAGALALAVLTVTGLLGEAGVHASVLPAETLATCVLVTPLHDRLTNARGKPSRDTFGSRADTKDLKSIASEFASISGAARYATRLVKSEPGDGRRSAIAQVYKWCNARQAYDATQLIIAPKFEATDADVVVTGTTNPGATVTVTPAGGTLVTVVADGNGAFSIAIPDLPFDQDVQATVKASELNRSDGSRTTALRRSLSPAKKAELAARAEADFKASAQTPPYNELIKYTPGTIGSPVVYRTKVFQYDFNTGTGAFLGYVTPGRYDFWNDLVYFKLADPALGSGISKDSVITVWGTVAAPYSYSTRQGTNSVPAVTVTYIG